MFTFHCAVGGFVYANKLSQHIFPDLDFFFVPLHISHSTSSFYASLPPILCFHENEGDVKLPVKFY